MPGVATSLRSSVASCGQRVRPPPWSSQKYSPALVLPQNTLEEGATPYVLGTVGAVYYQPDGITYSDPNGRVHIPVSVGEVAAARAIREVETGQWRSNWDKVATPVERHVPEEPRGASGYLSHPVLIVDALPEQVGPLALPVLEGVDGRSALQG